MRKKPPNGLLGSMGWLSTQEEQGSGGWELGSGNRGRDTGSKK